MLDRAFVTWRSLRRTACLGALAGVLAYLPIVEAAATRPATGTWVGRFRFDGTFREMAFQLHERANGDLIGYVLGGTQSRTVVSGRRVDRRVTFAFEQKSVEGTRAITFDGRMSGPNLPGIASEGARSYRMHLTRLDEIVHERRFLFAATGGGGGDIGALVEVAVAIDEAGRLVAGGFAGITGCGLWACDGGINSFAESPDGTTLTFELETDGGCSAGSELTATFDAARGMYTGSYTFHDCNGTTTGSLIGGRYSRTRSDHVESMLLGLGRIADDFAAGLRFTVPHPSFSDGYVDFGETQSDVIASFNTEIATYADIATPTVPVRMIHSVSVGSPFPGLVLPFGAELDEVRAGTRRSDGLRLTYLDTRQRPRRPRLRVWRSEKGPWVIAGNGSDFLRLPFDFKFDFSNGESLLVLTPNGPLHASPGPFGAHVSPLTGHPYGDAKGNFAGFYTRGDSDLTELRGDGDLIREPGELWAYFGGTDGSGIRNRMPTYIAPLPSTLTSVSRVTPSAIYFDGVPQWRIELQIASGERIRFDHLGSLSPYLRGRLEAAGVDLTEPVRLDEELLGSRRLDIPQDAELASPQVMAAAVPGYDGYFVGGGTFGDRPWAQMEWQMVTPPGPFATDICYFDHVGRLVGNSLQALIDRQMADPQSQRYAAWQGERWRWSGESRLCMAYSALPRDFSALFTNLGGWFEVASGGVVSNELVAFAPLATDTATFDPSQYEPGVDMIVLRQCSRDAAGCLLRWRMPDGEDVVVDYPAGEIVERGPDSFVVKWRDIGGRAAVYQRAAFLLSHTGLTIRWGAFADTAGGAVAAPVDAATACDGTTIVCYDHTSQRGF